MSIEFMCNGEGMEAIRTNMINAQAYMKQAYDDALSLQSDITAKEHWTGNAELVAEDFLNLLIQYQTAFNESDNPQEQAINAFNELNDNLDAFYSSWEDYVALERRTL